MLVRFQVSSSLWFYISFEACLLPIIAIIIGFGPQPERVQATISIMLYTILSSIPFLIVLLSVGPLTL